MSSVNTENKKAFDPTNSFTFFGTWVKTIEKLETEQDRSSNAYMLFKAIANYSMYNENPDFNTNILDAIWTMMEREIDNSISRRKSNFANDEINEKHQAIINAIIKNPSLSMRDIASITGTNKSMVDRVKRKYSQQINEGISNIVNDSVCDIENDSGNCSDNNVVSDSGNNVVNGSVICSGNDFVSDSGNYINNYSGNDNDTMGLGRDGTAGQYRNVPIDDEDFKCWMTENDGATSDDDLPF